MAVDFNIQTLYGRFPTYLVAQRASSLQTTTACAASILSVSTGLGAWAGEVQATLVALGFWKGAA